jgi:hypothetical protein
MKILFTLSILMFALSSFACEQYEAQFGGTVNEVTQTADGCMIDVDLEVFNEHFFCPLLKEDVHNNKILLSGESCEGKMGMRVGGILVYGQNQVIEIE